MTPALASSKSNKKLLLMDMDVGEPLHGVLCCRGVLPKDGPEMVSTTCDTSAPSLTQIPDMIIEASIEASDEGERAIAMAQIQRVTSNLPATVAIKLPDAASFAMVVHSTGKAKGIIS